MSLLIKYQWSFGRSSNILKSVRVSTMKFILTLHFSYVSGWDCDSNLRDLLPDKMCCGESFALTYWLGGGQGWRLVGLKVDMMFTCYNGCDATKHGRLVALHCYEKNEFVVYKSTFWIFHVYKSCLLRCFWSFLLVCTNVRWRYPHLILMYL